MAEGRQLLIIPTQDNIRSLLAEANQHVPQADVDLFRHAAGTPDAFDKVKNMTEDEVRTVLVSLRYSNSICDKCWKKGPNVKLLVCAACKLVFYCSEACRAGHTEKHAQRCCKPDGPLDDGPQQLTLVPIGGGHTAKK